MIGILEPSNPAAVKLIIIAAVKTRLKFKSEKSFPTQVSNDRDYRRKTTESEVLQLLLVKFVLNSRLSRSF